MAEEKQKRMTRQKRVVYEVVRDTDTHPTAEWIYGEARKCIPDISLGTVYRNLQVLEEEGRVRILTCDKGQSHFDGNTEPHYHFVCENCGHILDFNEPGLVSKRALEAAPGHVHSHTLLCFGICRACLDKNKVD